MKRDRYILTLGAIGALVIAGVVQKESSDPDSEELLVDALESKALWETDSMWGFMHLALLVDEAYELSGPNGRVRLREVLEPADGGQSLLFNPLDCAPYAQSPSVFMYEKEDHYGQTLALYAMGSDLRSERRAEVWDPLAVAFLRAGADIPSDEEPSWLLALGGCVYRYLENGSRKSEVAALVEVLLTRDWVGADSPSCGGAHLFTGIAICSSIPMGPELKKSVENKLRAFYLTIELNTDSRGYAALGGLHDPFASPGPKEVIRVNGHLAEFLSFYSDVSSHESERMLTALRHDVRESLPTSQRELGAWCHAAAALRRIDVKAPKQ